MFLKKMLGPECNSLKKRAKNSFLPGTVITPLAYPDSFLVLFRLKTGKRGLEQTEGEIGVRLHEEN